MPIKRIPQRTQSDCAVCSVAMVLGYSYERVQGDRDRYSQFTDREAWWGPYLADEGRSTKYVSLGAISSLPGAGGAARGLLVLRSPLLRAAHLVAIDELGFVDPADGFPDHVPYDRYFPIKALSGFAPADSNFLAITATNMPMG